MTSRRTIFSVVIVLLAFITIALQTNHAFEREGATAQCAKGAITEQGWRDFNASTDMPPIKADVFQKTCGDTVIRRKGNCYQARGSGPEAYWKFVSKVGEKGCSKTKKASNYRRPWMYYIGNWWRSSGNATVAQDIAAAMANVPAPQGIPSGWTMAEPSLINAVASGGNGIVTLNIANDSTKNLVSDSTNDNCTSKFKSLKKGTDPYKWKIEHPLTKPEGGLNYSIKIRPADITSGDCNKFRYLQGNFKDGGYDNACKEGNLRLGDDIGNGAAWEIWNRDSEANTGKRYLRQVECNKYLGFDSSGNAKLVDQNDAVPIYIFNQKI